VHYELALEQARRLGVGIRRKTLEALRWLVIDEIERLRIFDAG
jgi:hypothetical protein